MRRTILTCMISIAVLLPNAHTFADAIYTADGSKLVGTIEQMTGDKIVITTAVVGKVEIDASQVVAVGNDNPLTVQFESGDRLVGKIEVSADRSSSTMHTGLGDVSIDPKKIAAIWPVGGESPEVIALKKETETRIAEIKPNWTVTMEAGGSRSEGNTDTLEARGRLDAVRKTKDDLLNFYLAAQYSEQNDLRTTNEYRGGVKYEDAITENWYWFTRLELEFDEFENLDLRSTAAVGAGRYWLKEDDHEFKTRLGAGYRHESFNNGRTNNSSVVDVGLDYRVDLAPWVQFTHSATYSPDFLEFNDYRLDLDTGLIFPFKDDRVKLKLGMRNEYNSSPQPGLERLDNTFYANLVLALKR